MAKKIGIPWELKFNLAMRGWSTILGRFLYAIRERFGAAVALEICEKVWKMGDAVKNLTNFIKTAFKIEGNDAETMAKWFNVLWEIYGTDYTPIELTKTYFRQKIYKCPWKTAYKDISDWCKIWFDIVYETINPKATQERVKSMCVGDLYCELVFRIEK